MSLTKRFIICLFCAASLLTAARAQQQPAPQKQEPTPAKRNARPDGEKVVTSAEPFDRATVEQMSKQCVTLDTESGEIVIEMLAEAAPESVRNFLNLTAIGAFDTTTFSRVVKGFIIQGGNMSTREKLTPELAQRARRTVADEPNGVKHERGIVSMARTDQANSATTHFFILAGPGAHLDGTFAAFGRVLRGMDVVDAINNGELEGDKPTHPVRLRHANLTPCPPPQTTQPQ
jgi:peptidyl-prolyl cis-trans isomerase B (cyclophilin B)